MKIVFYTFVIVLLLCVSIGALWVVSIWYRVTRSPRSEMFMCNKHGMMLPKDCIKFLGTEYCPYCFHENMNKAEKIGMARFLKRNGAPEGDMKMLQGVDPKYLN